MLLFSNPASTKTRERMTIRYSADDGRTWSNGKVLHAGRAAYSCLTSLPEGQVGCLYEGGEHTAYETLTFARFGVLDIKESRGLPKP